MAAAHQGRAARRQERAHLGAPRVRTVPQLRIDDAEFGAFEDAPVGPGDVADDLLTRAWPAFESALAPNQAPRIPFIGQHALHRIALPAGAAGPELPVAIQPVHDGGHAQAVGIQLEDLTHDARFRLDANGLASAARP